MLRPGKLSVRLCLRSVRYPCVTSEPLREWNIDILVPRKRSALSYLCCPCFYCHFFGFLLLIDIIIEPGRAQILLLSGGVQSQVAVAQTEIGLHFAWGGGVKIGFDDLPLVGLAEIKHVLVWVGLGVGDVGAVGDGVKEVPRADPFQDGLGVLAG